MWISREYYERLVSEASLAQHVPKLELRAETAEAALVAEREQRMRDVRHVLSMWLRHERSSPLPATATERDEAKAERARRASEPIELNADQLARREAVREWGKQHGFTQEEADQSFMAQLQTQVDE